MQILKTQYKTHVISQAESRVYFYFRKMVFINQMNDQIRQRNMEKVTHRADE